MKVSFFSWRHLRIILLSSFALLVGFAQVRQSLRPDASARLEIVVQRTDSGEVVPARVYLFKADQPFGLSPVECHLPLRFDWFYRERLWHRSQQPKTLEVTANDESHFILLEGRGTFDLPAHENYRLEVYRGFFYKPVIKEFSLESEKTRRVIAKLEPIAPSRQEKWLAADAHIHLMRAKEDDAVFLRWLEAEDLAVGNFLELQRQQHAALQYAYGREGEAHSSRYAIRSGHESRSAFYGHTIFLGPKQMIRPLSIGSDLANSPAAYPFPTVLFEKGRDFGAVTGFAHLGIYGGDIPNSTLLMNLARNTIDFVELFQFGDLALDKWYELLNAGFRVVGLAGSDFPVPLYTPYPRSKDRQGSWLRGIPLLGPERALVKTAAGDSAYEAWADGVHRGAVVLTNGPLLEFSANGKSSGAIVEWSGETHKVEGTATAVFHRPIEKVEIVVNGEVVATRAGDGINHELSLRYGVEVDASSWIAARAVAASKPEEPQTWAHANPVYLLREGEPVYVKAARKAVRDLWEKETAYYKSPSFVFEKMEQRQELFDLIEETRKILEGPQPKWPSKK